MKQLLLVLIPLLLTSGRVLADARSITSFSNGAIVEIEMTATGGRAVIPLQSGMIDNSLRITPLGNARIRQVQIVTLRRDASRERELATLLEQRTRLEERIQTLATREQIFTAAAKSQSSKAPRTTKTNPDPLSSIRQGTDFAMARLEAVATEQHRAMERMRRIDARIAELRQDKSTGRSLARLKVTPLNGRIRAHYALAGYHWSPRYDLHVQNNGTAALTLYGQLPMSPPGYRLRVAPDALENASRTATLPAAAGSLSRLMDLTLPVEDPHFDDGPRASFTMQLTNSSSIRLPAGEAALYRNGAYLGRLAFQGLSSGRAGKISSSQ